MFFDNKKYFDFVKAARKIGITVPIIPGIKPIAIKKHLQLLPQVFRIDLPQDLIDAVEKCADNKQIRQVGIEWAINQSKELKAAAISMCLVPLFCQELPWFYQKKWLETFLHHLDL